MLGAIWLSRNNDVFNKVSISIFLYACYLQGYPLNKNMDKLPKRRKAKKPNCLLIDTNFDNRDFRQTWMVVY
jgi:hypothetical protein